MSWKHQRNSSSLNFSYVFLYCMAIKAFPTVASRFIERLCNKSTGWTARTRIFVLCSNLDPLRLFLRTKKIYQGNSRLRMYNIVRHLADSSGLQNTCVATTGKIAIDSWINIHGDRCLCWMDLRSRDAWRFEPIDGRNLLIILIQKYK